MALPEKIIDKTDPGEDDPSTSPGEVNHARLESAEDNERQLDDAESERAQQYRKDLEAADIKGMTDKELFNKFGREPKYYGLPDDVVIKLRQREALLSIDAGGGQLMRVNQTAKPKPMSVEAMGPAVMGEERDVAQAISYAEELAKDERTFSKTAAYEKRLTDIAEARVPDPSRYDKYSDDELETVGQQMRQRLAEALDDASHEEELDGETELSAEQVINATAASLVDIAKQKERRAGGVAADAEDGADPFDRLTRIPQKDIDELVAKLDGPLNEEGDNNLLQSAAAMARFYQRASSPDLSVAQRVYALEKAQLLRDITATMFEHGGEVVKDDPRYDMLQVFLEEKTSNQG